MTFTTSVTSQGLPVALLSDGDKLVAKVYPNHDGTKLRVVLPELVSFKQSRIDIDSHYIEFEREVF